MKKLPRSFCSRAFVADSCVCFINELKDGFGYLGHFALGKFQSVGDVVKDKIQP